jgi:DNA-binding response OmpR family regulator
MFDQHGDAIALMITDVMMPGETGTELALDVRRRWPQLAVIFISGYSDAELPEGVGASLVDDFVQKPFTGAQLLARVEARLQAHRSRLPSVAHSR